MKINFTLPTELERARVKIPGGERVRFVAGLYSKKARKQASALQRAAPKGNNPAS